jgi:hypothetical protein
MMSHGNTDISKEVKAVLTGYKGHSVATETSIDGTHEVMTTVK